LVVSGDAELLGSIYRGYVRNDLVFPVPFPDRPAGRDRGRRNKSRTFPAPSLAERWYVCIAATRLAQGGRGIGGG